VVLAHAAWAALDPSRVLREAAAADALPEPQRPLCGLAIGLKDVLDATGACALFFRRLQPGLSPPQRP